MGTERSNDVELAIAIQGDPLLGTAETMFRRKEEY